MPLVTDPTASLNTFPCSSVTCAASMSMSLNNSSLNLNIILDLVSGGVVDQEVKAVLADAMATPTSLSLAKLTSAIFSPKAGLNTSPNLFDLLIYSSPLIK